MNKIKSLIAGFAGAVALNVLHETFKKEKSNVPRIDLLGEDALQKVLRHLGTSIQNKQNLYKVSLAGDVLSNTMYYSLIGAGNPTFMWPKAVVLGLSAGVGALTLPEPLGLNPEPVTKTNQVKILTVGYYVFGAIVTGLVLNLLSKK
jgi:hypothetical protein